MESKDKKLKSSDGAVKEVKSELLNKSKLLKGLVEDYQGDDDEIPLNEVDSKNLDLIIKYLEHYKGDLEPKEIPKPFPERTDDDFLKGILNDDWTFDYLQALSIEEAINLEFSAVGSSVYLVVHPYISSNNKAVTRSDQTFEITSFNKTYILYLGPGSSSIENTFFLLTDLDTPEEDYIKAATFVFRMKTNPSVSDSRIMGGGLPDDQPDDYDMLDIGHVFGRPYRVGATLIIRLPLKLSAYEERIRTELDKHIAAGDEYVLSFEGVTEQ